MKVFPGPLFTKYLKVKMNISESLEPVLKQANHVHVDKTTNFAKIFERNKLNHWLSISPFDINQLDENEKLGYLITLDSISFSYWGCPKWAVNYQGKEYDGAQALMACLGRALGEGFPIFDPKYLAAMKRRDLEQILRGNIEIPLLDERLRIINEVGNITEEKFRGDFRSILDEAQNDAIQLVNVLVNNFPSFEDFSLYRKKRVCFNKRAQLLASDLNYFFDLDNVNRLTACADYKLPQVLRRHGILQYSDDLLQKIRRGEEIPVGSEQEVEIRAHTIHAVELIKEQITDVTANQVNDYLWLEGQVKLKTDEPYHLTRTTAY